MILKLGTMHGVQRRMISVDNFFVFLRFLFFALLLLYVTYSARCGDYVCPSLSVLTASGNLF